MITKRQGRNRRTPATRTLTFGVGSFAAVLVAAIFVWHALFWLCFGKPDSYLPAVPAFLLVCGPFLCLALTLALTWDYFHSRKWDKSIFVLGLVTSLSPLFFFGLIAAMTFLEHR